MIKQVAQPESNWVLTLVLIGAGYAIIIGLGLALVRLVKMVEPLDFEAALAGLAFGVVYVAPFALAIWAVLWSHPGLRAGVWIASAILSFLASFTAFSGVSLLFLPAVPILAIAAFGSIVRSILNGGDRVLFTALPVALGAVVTGVGAFLIMIALTSDPRCWALFRYADGHTAWARDPEAEAGITITRGPNGETGVFGSTLIDGPAIGGVTRTQSTCSSDVISPFESTLSMGLWAVAGIVPGALSWRLGSTPRLATG